MNIIKTFRIIVGVLLLIDTITIFALLFLEIDSLAVIFNFGIDIQAENLGEAIVEAVANIAAGIVFFFVMIFFGIINAAIYITFGTLTITLKRNKAIPIIVVVITGFSLFLGMRAFLILTLGDIPSLILPLRIISDFVVIGLSITNFILILRAEKVPRVESSA